MRLTTKNIMKLGVYPVKEIQSKKTRWYKLIISGKEIHFKKYSHAINGYVTAVRSKYPAKIEAVIF